VLGGLALVLAIGVVFLWGPVPRGAVALTEWIRGAGGLGVVVAFACYVAATVLMVPGTAPTLLIGFLYGPLWATLLVSPASVVGAILAFLLARGVLRRPVARRVAAHPRFAAVDRAVATNGFKVVLLLRLSPLVPFNLLNYGLGLTRVRLRDYALASFLGMLPGTLLYCYLGSLVASATELAAGKRPSAGPAGVALFGLGLVATLVLTVWLARLTRRELARTLSERSPS
jgi:uncharacterized membrane protein YdjX (TVP38/TMEM64 family)